MSDLTVCQPGWFAVFEDVKGGNFSTEPVACWLLVVATGTTDVRPICALGGDVCDATLAANYIGVVGPGTKPEVLVEAARVSRAQRSA